jgi:tRNA 2-selenouridine synthase
MATYKHIDISQAFNRFDDIIDVRSPAEFADDHMPSAINLAVLNDEQRIIVGTTYSRVSPFEAKKLGAALIARNIAQHLEQSLLDKPKSWRPLVVCWRGGMRSGAMAHILAQIGFHVTRLDGGYKSYRRHVTASIETLPNNFSFRVISGCTGSGKSKLLQLLAENGAQVLDLEKLAQHRGSLLGRLPNQAQPSQKMFETHLWQALSAFKPSRPVYIESESRKVGVLSLPTSLVLRMRQSECIRMNVPTDVRVKFLINDYEHFVNNPQLLIERLELLVETHGHKITQKWSDLALKSEWTLLVHELLTQHYDPAYQRLSNFGAMAHNKPLDLEVLSLDDNTLTKLAQDLIQHERKYNG